MKKSNLSAKEIKSLLMAKNDVRMFIQKTFNKKIGEAIHQEIQPEESPAQVAVKNGFTNQFFDLIADRLSKNQQDILLFSSSDLPLLTSAIVKLVEKEQGYELDVDERKLIEKLIGSLFEGMLGMLHDMVPDSSCNLYVEYWRWIDTVLNLSAERGIPATEIFKTEAQCDEITRRLYSKEQFLVQNNKDILGKFTAEKLKKTIILPILNAMIEVETGEEEEDREEIRQELEKELEKEVMPQIRIFVEAAKNIGREWIDKEINRIYA